MQNYFNFTLCLKFSCLKKLKKKKKIQRILTSSLLLELLCKIKDMEDFFDFFYGKGKRAIAKVKYRIRSGSD